MYITTVSFIHCIWPAAVWSTRRPNNRSKTIISTYAACLFISLALVLAASHLKNLCKINRLSSDKIHRLCKNTSSTIICGMYCCCQIVVCLGRSRAVRAKRRQIRSDDEGVCVDERMKWCERGTSTADQSNYTFSQPQATKINRPIK